ncbi:MAG: RsmE family RNA methyltransferase [Spirochaetes bacterium]|jgi:16S rRNA U1498 N3-methylase RsmE|nr:RsmE family RNA methyltransferase [Spirochaetota bacterium]
MKQFVLPATKAGEGELTVVEAGVTGVMPMASRRAVKRIDAEEAEVGLLFHEKALAESSIGGYLKAGPRRVAIVIGPEGGFSDHEVDILDRLGFNPVLLGQNIPRTESAAIYAIAVVQSVYRELVAWNQ